MTTMNIDGKVYIFVRQTKEDEAIDYACGGCAANTGNDEQDDKLCRQFGWDCCAKPATSVWKEQA